MKAILLMLVTLFIFNSDLYSQWVQTPSSPDGAGVTDMVIANDGSLIVTTASYNWPSGQKGGIKRSTNFGISWQNISNIYNARTLCLGSSGRLFASCWDYPQNEGMFFSTNNGLNWQQSFFGAANDNVFSIAAKNGDSMVFIGTRNGVYRQFNNGTWLQIMTGMPVNSWVRDLAISPEGYIAAATTNGVYISTNQGNQWNAIPGMQTGDTAVIVKFVESFTDFGNTKDLKVGTDNGKVYESGAPYTALAISAIFDAPMEITFLGANFALNGFQILALFPGAGGIQGGIAKSTNGGANFSMMNEGLPNPAPVSSAVVSEQAIGEFNMFLGMFKNEFGGAKIYKRFETVGIHQISTEVPKGFSLSQNYPNPFNPVTKFKFQVSSLSDVKIVVFDGLGREVETLVNKQMIPGTYEVDFDGSKYSSGVYYYKLISDKFSETKKMMLIK